VSKLEQHEFQREMGKIEALIQQIEESADPSAQATAKELVQTLLTLHGNGLERMLEIIYQSSAAGQTLIDQIAEDELVGNLLILRWISKRGCSKRSKKCGPISFHMGVMSSCLRLRMKARSVSGSKAVVMAALRPR
jgi:hypothetical protein